MNIWHNVSPERISPEDFLAVIEIKKGSKTKYELDKDAAASAALCKIRAQG